MGLLKKQNVSLDSLFLSSVQVDRHFKGCKRTLQRFQRKNYCAARGNPRRISITFRFFQTGPKGQLQAYDANRRGQTVVALARSLARVERDEMSYS